METPTDFKGLVDGALELVALGIPLTFSIVFLFIVWKVIDAWIINADDENKRTEGKTIILIGVIVFVVMISVWGIVELLRSSFL